MSEKSDFRMLQALTKHILKHRQTSYLAITATQTLIVIGLWEAFPHHILIAWYLAMQVIAVPHLIVCLKYAGKELSADDVQYIKVVFILYALASSAQWGGITWFLSETCDIYAFIIWLPLLGIIAGAINLAAILSIYFCLVGPILVQSLVVLVFTEAANPLIAGLFVIYYVGMIKFALDLNKMLVHTYSMQVDLESANTELVIQKQAAEKANKDKSRFLAAASHDLRQPLYAMELFIGGLSKECGVTEGKNRDLLNRLRNAMDSMKNMFNSLLDMSRFDAGVIVPQKRNVSANQLFDVLKQKFHDECDKKGISLVVRPTGYWLYTDPVLIQSVLENYMSNAVKYTDSGSILLACRKRGNNAQFEVWDTGRGIKREDIGSVYDAFHQLDNPERDRRKGVGLGLSIVYQIAALLDAPLSVRSKYGRGSVFTIKVPCGTAQQVLEHESNVHIEHNAELFFDLSVWIVDDDEDILEGLELQLESWGAITRTFQTPEQLQVLLNKRIELPDLLICDLRLRNYRNGVEVIEMVRQQSFHKIPAVLITGDTGPAELQAIKKVGIPLLHKPVTSEKLQQTITRVMNDTRLVE